MTGITLQQAREAAQQLSDLQSKAALLPVLEQQQAEQQTQAQLDRLRAKTQSDIDSLYSQFIAAYDAYKVRFSAVIQALGDCSKAYQNFEKVKKQIREKVDSYVGAKVNYALKFQPGFDLYRDSVSVELQAQNDLAIGVLDVPMTPSDKGLGVIDSIFRMMIQYF